MITPAEDPSVGVMNLGPGLRTGIPSTLPMVVDRPAGVDSNSANPMFPPGPPQASQQAVRAHHSLDDA